ncbi:MAG: S41 family peptidase, partial [Bdellovibrionota bacterium]
MKNLIRIGRLQTWFWILALGFIGCAPKPQNSAMSYSEFIRLESALGVPTEATQECGTACQGLRREFRFVVYVGKQIYCYWEEKKAETGIRFDELAENLEYRISNETSPTEYYRILMQWAAAFHDGHVNAMHKDDRSDLEIYTSLVRLEVFGAGTDHEKVYVVESKSENLAAVGDEVLAVNEVSTGEALKNLDQFVSGSTARMRHYNGVKRLVDAVGIAQAVPLNLKLRGSNGVVRNVSLQRNVEMSPTLSKGLAANAPPATGMENFKAQVLPGEIGYLRIDAFTGEQSYALLEQAMHRLARTKGLLIDLRKNGGGDPSGDQILSRLTSKNIIRYRVSERISDFLIAARPEYFGLPIQPGALFADWHNREVSPSPAPDTYVGKPVVALISPRCFSACDTFTAALQANGLATVVGEPTGGGTGTPHVFDLPISGHKFRYSVVSGRTALWAPIEGRGTTPDIWIEPTIRERISGQDLQLEAALRVLNDIIGGSNRQLSSQRLALD